MDGDPCVRAEMMVCEVHACHGFPGDGLAEPEASDLGGPPAPFLTQNWLPSNHFGARNGPGRVGVTASRTDASNTSEL